MVEPGSEVTEIPALVVTLIVGATIIVIVYISSLFKSQKDEEQKRSLEGEQSASGKQVHAHTQDVQHANGAGNARRKQQHKQQQQQMRNTGGASKQPTNFSHPLLMTQLKGHGGAVLDMDFSPNGRFLATCADDGASSGTSSGSEGNKENTPSKTVGLSRRQKKNYRGRREDSSSPGTTVKKKSVTSGRLTKSLLNHDINKQYAKLCWKGVSGGDMTIIHHLKKHVLNPDDLLWMGYPVESSTYPGHAIVYKPALDYSKTIHNTHHYNRSKSPMKTAASEQSDQPIMGFDVNAREFVPKVVNYGTTLIKRNSDPDFKAQIPAATSPKKMCANECQAARKCVRCGKEYFVSQDGSYLTTEQCVYHWGKLRTQFDRNSLYECCKGEQNTKGCTTGKLHVWNGLHENCFNPVPGFVKTRPRKTPLPESLGLSVYAIDCEMCYTTQGFELARITVVSSDGRLVYDTYVRPENEVVDYNTRFSGITANEINKQGASKVLREVQNDLMGFIYADTILIGHGVENDLIALKMIHTTIIDTAYVFPHFFGLPYKRSLKSLVKFCLKREIQMEATGHDSFEDARSCLELMLWKLQEDHAQSSVLSANRL
ncbi:RNA exonuclease 3-like isoform X3 [Nilaparvata lugens]|uniref:RNA exonuclease 3-like isoform X3 n=1 Tax=Nilaparvata lugens TaxID=108931 RepID=UPI00193DD6D7|nr:RNA exonuclease 3-like isoform X3 [Nilaparvata lugens]